MSSHIHSLPWAEIIIGKCDFHSSPTDRSQGVIEWHDAAATLFILMENREEIYLEMDNEIFDVKYQVLDDATTAVITMCMEPSRPLPWAAGTGFDPFYDDSNTLGIRLHVKGKDSGRLYEDLIQWIMANVPHECTPLSHSEADVLWMNLANVANVLEVSDDEEEANSLMAEHVVNDKYGSLTRSDLERLETGQWANDSVVDWCRNYFSAMATRAHTGHKTFVMPPWFYANFTENPDRVLTWDTPDVFELDLLVFLIHHRSHWLTVVVHKPGSCVATNGEDNGTEHSESNESDVDDGDETTSIFILDSIYGGHPPSLEKTIQAYLEKKCLSQGTLKFMPNRISVECPMVPQQQNWDDCGYYMIHFMHRFITQPRKCLANIRSGMSKQLTSAWGDPAEMRQVIKGMVEGTVKNRGQP